MATISFDFDNTLWDDDARDFIWDTVTLLRKHIADGDDVVIVTSRLPRWIQEVKDKLSMLKLDLAVHSAPADKDMFVAGTLVDGVPCRTKSNVLIAIGAIKHFDDLPDHPALDDAKATGIQILLPPATQAVKSNLYN